MSLCLNDHEHEQYIVILGLLLLTFVKSNAQQICIISRKWRFYSEIIEMNWIKVKLQVFLICDLLTFLNRDV